MGTLGIIQIHDDISRSNGNYCSICFRSAKERRLVEPVCFKVFLTHMTGFRPFKTLKICYICESLAASAVRFQRAVLLASEVGELHHDVSGHRLWEAVVSALMDGHVNKKSSDKLNPIVRRAVTIDKSLRATPGYELYRTDTLVVSSGKTQRQADFVAVVEDEVVSRAPGRAPLPPRVAPAKVMPDEMQLRVVNQETNEFILHPMVKGTDGNIYVPSLQLQIMDNGIFKSVPDAQIQNCIPSQIQNTNTQTHNNTTQVVQETALNKQNVTREVIRTYKNKKIKDVNNKTKDYHNFLLTQMKEKQLEKNNIDDKSDRNIINVNDRKRRLDPLKLPDDGFSELQHILKENAHGACVIKYDDETVTSVETVNSVENGLMVSQGPVLRTDRTVDWEDKIPMDVISFVDATDPNPQERIMQPRARAASPGRPAERAMGVISDVRTVPDEIECIDLC